MSYILLRLRRILECYGGAAVVPELVVAFVDKSIPGEILERSGRRGKRPKVGALNRESES